MIKPEPLTLKMSAVIELFQAYQMFGGYNKIDGDKKSVRVPFDIAGLTRVAMGLNLRDIRPLVDAHNDAMGELRKLHTDDGEAFGEAARTLAETTHEILQRKIKIDDLKPEENPIDPGVYMLLAPVLLTAD